MSEGRLAERRDEIMLAFVKHNGNMTHTAKALGVSRVGLWKHVKDDEVFQELIQHCRESMIDEVENIFEQNCLDGSPEFQTSRIFFLKTRASHRGYKQETNVRISDGRAELVDELVQPGDNPDAAN